MKKLSLIAALAVGGLLACSTVAMAQSTNAPGKGGKQRMTVEQRLERMSTALSLTDEQKPKVKAVLEETQAKMQDIPREDRREKMPAVMEEQNKKIKAILTPEQMEKYTTLM